MQINKIPGRVLLKAAGLAVFLLLALAVLRFSALKDLLNPESMAHLLERFGMWGPVFFVCFYAAGLCLLVPSSVLCMLGAALFGVYRGFVYVWIGAIIGAGASFLIARTLGRDFAAALIGDRLKRFERAFQENGFTAVLYIRLLNMPFTYSNFGIGLTGVRFSHYMLATAIGMVIGLFTFVLLGGTLKEAWVTGHWSVLVSGKALLTAGLYTFSFFIPKIVNRLKLI